MRGLRTTLFIATLTTGTASTVEDALSGALAVDDDCSADTGSSCTLHALQRRALAGQNASTTPRYDASCFGSAGSSTCRASSGSGKCVCDTGCMGADGNCYPQRNKVIAQGFTLKNVKWQDQKIYVQRVSVFNQLKTTSYSSKYNFGQDKFALYELPGLFEGKRMFFLASQKWPSYIFSIRATKGTALSLWGTYAMSLEKSHEPWQLKDLMMQICSARKKGHPDAVMFGTSVPVGGSSIWAYIKSGTYFVYGFWYPERVVIQMVEQQLSPGQAIPHPEAESPGTAGYWVPDPPFPSGLIPDC